ncbi:Retrovirus-related Pol polyprotein from transposon 17.6 [Cucumis melo var. makuwa]|uniref:Retrovirus-related Pol polyprotein from transposon 17.6 n=1 Tax=Cucumis melo var. makuwa TaxID=1194695 RepID=A0A5A7V586_CUCMM|nr:Retrovirus-related Pol polyprotein from transposon 17.6 [Cucumis melo var. makuwa]
MVEGIVLGHKISNMGLEVDPAKIDVAFQTLKDVLTSTSVLVAPDWSQPFELMCDASDVVVGDMPGQKKDKVTDPIYYAIKTLNEAEENYTTIEKELLAIVFAIEKFRSYIVGSKVTIHSDHSAIRYLMAKKDAKSWLIR